MFGTYRTLLAIMVVFSHLGGVPVLGGYAVFGFYILSGYLMTLIMHTSYDYSTVGVKKYFLNRLLRIYPLYWLSCLISIALIYWFGSVFTSNYHRSIFMPIGVNAAFKNIFLMLSANELPRLTPPSWALTVEIFFYLCIGFGLSKSKTITGGWFIASIIYTLIAIVRGFSWDFRYTIIPAASLPFSTGALIYHFKNDFFIMPKIVQQNYIPYIIFTTIIMNWYIAFLKGTLMGLPFYVNYFLCSLMVLSLSNKTSILWISKKFDKWMGDLSYPIYLIHYQVGMLVVVVIRLLWFDIARPHFILALASLPIIFIFSWFIAVSIEIPIDRIRKKIKN